MNRVDIVCIRTSARPVPRLVRFVSVAKELGMNAVYLGAIREENLKTKDIVNEIPVYRVGKYYPMLNGKSLFTYIWGTLAFNLSVFNFLIKARPKIVHISDVESFLAGYFYKIMFRKKAVYNIHDNLAQRYPLPSALNGILNFIEGIIVLLCDASMAPEDFRVKALPKFCHKKVTVVRNAPMDIKAFDGIEIGSDNETVIVYSGWVDEKRGVNSLLNVADKIDNLKVIVVGEGDPALIDRIKSHSKCEFKGYVSYKESIELLKDAHFVYIHYSPERIINRFAAPNKLSESLAVGRIPIINSEIVLSKKVIDKTCGVVTDYGDDEALISAISELVNNNARYQDMCIRGRELFEEEYSWEVIRDRTKAVIKGVMR